MRCDELMTRDVGVCGIGDGVRDAARKMRDLNVGFVPVCDGGGTVVGVVTDRDLALRVLAEDLPDTTELGDVMTEELVVCRPEDDVSRAEELMRTNQKNRILCVDETGRLAGVISLSDIAQVEPAARVGELLGDVTEREVAGPH